MNNKNRNENRNNVNLKALRVAFSLKSSEVASICGVSKATASCWLRSPTSVKSGSGLAKGRVVSRYREMSDDQFDLFCSNMADWGKQNITIVDDSE